jgi:hypothetical protein
MNPKTSFSFELQYAPDAKTPYADRDTALGKAEPALQALFAAQDKGAAVSLNNSQKGSGSRILELSTTLDDAQIAVILKTFSEQNGLSISALE